MTFSYRGSILIGPSRATNSHMVVKMEFLSNLIQTELYSIEEPKCFRQCILSKQLQSRQLEVQQPTQKSPAGWVFQDNMKQQKAQINTVRRECVSD